MRWYPVELHTHTCHSDGSFTVEALVDAAARNGYRALALTDHNTSKNCPAIICVSLMYIPQSLHSRISPIALSRMEVLWRFQMEGL